MLKRLQTVGGRKCTTELLGNLCCQTLTTHKQGTKRNQELCLFTALRSALKPCDNQVSNLCDIAAAEADYSDDFPLIHEYFRKLSLTKYMKPMDNIG